MGPESHRPDDQPLWHHPCTSACSSVTPFCGDLVFQVNPHFQLQPTDVSLTMAQKGGAQHTEGSASGMGGRVLHMEPGLGLL